MKNEVIEKIRRTDKPVYIRFGFGWKGATWSHTTKEELICVIENGKFAHYDVESVNGGIGISFYSANDML